MRLPSVYLPHGGGPWPFVPGFENAQLSAYLRSLGQPARALLVISAHWEEPVPTVMSNPHPPMLYDYTGFPRETYALQWPAPGDPKLAERVRKLVSGAEHGTRGYDHGTFIPMLLAYPQANVPVVQLSLKKGLDPRTHIELGQALKPLRDEGVFIIGSGMSYHNMRGFGDPRALAEARQFDAWLHDTMRLPPAERNARLIDWEKAPAARAAHPREEHLLPLMVAAGAGEAASVGFSGDVLSMPVSAFHFA